jgi:predicted anti-sigma-YlaC factor YlaD
MKCEEIEAMLPAYVKPANVPLNVRRHLMRCSGCREALAQFEELALSLAGLETVAAEPPAGLRASLVAIPSEQTRLENVRSHVTRNRKAYAGLAVTAAGAVTAALWRSRRHRLATA